MRNALDTLTETVPPLVLFYAGVGVGLCTGLLRLLDMLQR